MIVLLALACAPKTAVLPLAERVETVQQFAIEARGRTMAGVAVAVFEGDSVRLQALSPAGTALFTVHAGPDYQEITSPDPRWTEVLDGLPFYRDLSLVHAWACPAGRCAVDTGRVRQEPTTDSGVERHFRGVGGPATATLWEGRAEVRDARRRYSVRFAGEDIRVR